MIEIPALEIMLRERGAERRLLVDSDSARVGSDAFCEVRLGPAQAAPEQLRLQARGERVFVIVVAAEPPVFAGGAPFSGGLLAPTAELRVGAVALRARVVERHPAPRASAPRRALGRLLSALGGVGIPLGILVTGTPPPDTWALPAEPQRLWATPPEAAGCLGASGTGRALGDDLAARAQLARERAPFNPRDGVHAVELSLRAAACYAGAGAGAEAAQARADAERARAQVEREFHVHQVRLERALEARDRERVQREIRLLLSFVAGRQSAYADWLVLLERQLDLQLAKEKP